MIQRFNRVLTKTVLTCDEWGVILQPYVKTDGGDFYG